MVSTSRAWPAGLWNIPLCGVTFLSLLFRIKWGSVRGSIRPDGTFRQRRPVHCASASVLLPSQAPTMPGFLTQNQASDAPRDLACARPPSVAGCLQTQGSREPMGAGRPSSRSPWGRALGVPARRSRRGECPLSWDSVPWAVRRGEAEPPSPPSQQLQEFTCASVPPPR